jgi:putrescine transport system permease protein
MGQMLGWPKHRDFLSLVLAHISFCMAYVTVTVLPRVASADMDLEEAAMDLGATRLRAFLEVTLPIIAPALISAWLLCFTLSLDDLVISSFVAGPGSSTLPMVIYSKVKLGVSPDMNALASLVILFVGIGVGCAGWTMRRADQRRLADQAMAGSDEAG